MSLPAFRLERPRTLEAALGILAGSGSEALILAGGTDAIPNLQMRLYAPRVVVDIKPLARAGLAGIEYSPERGLRIGALTTLTAICQSPVIRQQFPVLASAVATIAGPLQRNMGTLGGNLCLETRCRWYNQPLFWRQSLGGCLKLPRPAADGCGDGKTICHVAPGGKRCWAVWSGDAAPALLALDAEVEIASPAGLRRAPLRELYKNDGMDRLNLRRDEILTAVHVPPHMAGRRGSYHKLRIRHSIDYPLAGVAVTLDVGADGVCRDARVALTGVNPAPLLIPEAAEWLRGHKLDAQAIERVARRAGQVGKPLTTSASTPEYRREMLRVFTKRALTAAWNQQ